MAGGGHVRVDATVGPVRAAALPHGLVDLDVRHIQVVHVQALDLRGSKRKQRAELKMHNEMSRGWGISTFRSSVPVHPSCLDQMNDESHAY